MGGAAGDHAVFPVRSVGGSARRSIHLAGVVLALSSVVGLGLASSAGLVGGRAAALFAPSSAPAPALLAVSVAEVTPAPARTVEPAATQPPLIGLDVRPDGRHLFVHAEVFSARIVWVEVSILDAAGALVDRRSVQVPGGSTTFRIGGADAVDMRFDRPRSAGGMTVEAKGSDDAGDVVEIIEVSARGEIG